MQNAFDANALPALNLRQPQVRDLAWACFAPPMLQPCSNTVTTASFPLTSERKQWLLSLEHNPQPLLDWLQAHPSTRLGVYFERLWQFFLHADSETDLVARNLAVRDGGRTLGEFDCLYWCHRRETAVHLELAVKFYLGCGESPVGAIHSEAHQWLGPNAIDRLDLKLQRLLEHQVQLSRHPAAHAVLAAVHTVAPIREIVLAGSLFAPCDHTLLPPVGYNTQRPLRRWYPLQEWLTQSTGEQLVVPRLQWLAPLRAAGPGVSPSELAAHLRPHFERGGTPQLLATLDAHGNERERFFVTQDEWPNFPT